MADYPSSQPTFETPGTELSDPEHSSLHEKTDEELAAALAELGLVPSGTWSTVRARLDNVDGHLDSLPPAIIYGRDVGGTDASSDIVFLFGETFDAAPVVICTVERNNAAGHVCHVRATSTTGATVRITVNDATVPSVPSINLNWIAIGTLA